MPDSQHPADLVIGKHSGPEWDEYVAAVDAVMQAGRPSRPSEPHSLTWRRDKALRLTTSLNGLKAYVERGFGSEWWWSAHAIAGGCTRSSLRATWEAEKVLYGNKIPWVKQDSKTCTATIAGFFITCQESLLLNPASLDETAGFSASSVIVHYLGNAFKHTTHRGCLTSMEELQKIAESVVEIFLASIEAIIEGIPVQSC